MSYIKRKGAGLMGFGDASSCSTDQMWYPNLTFNGITGQCSTPAQAQAALASGAATGNLSGAVAPGAAGGSSSGGSWLDKLLGGAVSVATAKYGAQPTTNIYQAPGGMSDTAKLALAGAGVVALVLILKSRK